MELGQQLRLGISSPGMTNNIVVKLKPYIQPFERYLARAELHGLLGREYIKDPFSEPAEAEMLFPSSISLEMLRNRLAYWEKIGSWQLEPTLQVVLESEHGEYTANDDEVFDYHKSRRLRYGPHGLHEYRGKFFPQLVKSLINLAGLSPGSIVLDPMCGSGTTNCEARSMEMRTIGVDLNPLSVKVSQVKTSLFDVDEQLMKDQIERVLAHLETAEIDYSQTSDNWDSRELSYLGRWFSGLALRELAAVLDSIRTCHYALAREFMEVCFSNIINTVSWQKEADLRVRKQVKPYYSGTVITLFLQEVKNNLKRVLSYLSCFGNRREFPEFTIIEGDSRRLDDLLPDWVGRCDLLLTSPPYAMALPYIDTDRLSLAVLGLLPRSRHKALELKMVGNREITERQRHELWDNYMDRRSELPQSVNKTIEKIALSNHKEGIGFRRRNLPALLSRYFLDMTEAMRSARNMLKPGSFGFYVVGNNSTRISGERFTIETDHFLWEIGQQAGWKPKRVINMELLPSRDIFRHQRGTSESILWFEA